MTTVKEFRGLKVPLILGDGFECGVISNQAVVDDMNDGYHGALVVTSFAPRKNTGKQPVGDDVMVEGVLRNGRIMTTRNAGSVGWSLSNHRGDVITWKPSLNQPSSPNFAKSLCSVKVISKVTIGSGVTTGVHSNDLAKPTYTQAMHDAGELPPVGSMVALVGKTGCARIDEFLGKYIEIIGTAKTPHESDVITWSHPTRGLCCGIYNAEFFKPIKTEREKAIDDTLAAIGCAPHQDFIKGAPYIIEKLYDAGLLK